MIRRLSLLLKYIGAPPRDYWENELETPIDPVLERAVDTKLTQRWLIRQHGPHRIILHRLIQDLPAAVRAERGGAVFIPFMLVHEFMKHKSRAAAIDLGQRVLPEAIVELCRTNTGILEPKAIAYALFQHDYTHLLSILCLDKMHRTGFAQMRLRQNVRRPRQEFGEFLMPEVLESTLNTFDASGHPCRLKKVLHINGRHMVFIQRSGRPDRILRDGCLTHGHRPEWIMLDFSESAKQLRIASAGSGVGLEIARCLASTYYGVPCDYESEQLLTYRQQLVLFLRRLQANQDAQVRLIELSVCGSPLEGAPDITISSKKSIGRAIEHFERAVGKVFDDLQHVTGVSVLFCGKRVRLLFEPIEETSDAFIVRYRDQHLSPVESREFEGYLEGTYAIAAQSNERQILDAA